jgi:putative DNA primase/helicase
MLQPISEIESRPVNWLWPGRLALGKLSILDGDPGLGKSLLSLDLAARLTTGRPFPDGSPGPGVSNVVVLNAEDAYHDTVRPRLQAMGADLDRVLVLCQKDIDLGRLLRLPAETDELDAALTRADARLVILDPILAFLDRSINVNSDQSVRRALLPLTLLAERHRCVMQMVRHLNKLLGAKALYRWGGSIGFLAACRSGWLVAPDPDDPDRRVFAQLKNNLAEPQPSLAYSIEGGRDDPRICWHGESAHTADALLTRRRVVVPEGARDRARDFLANFLREGPRTSRELWEAACPQGLSSRTLYRAREELQVRITRVSRDNQVLNYWLLPGQQVPVVPSTDPDVPDLEQWLAPLRERYPPLTPLDEL